MKRKISFIALSLLILSLSQFNKSLAVNYLASDLLGQLDGSNNPVYTSSTQATGATGLSFPTMATLDAAGHRLFVTDCFNNRVLIFNLDNNNNLIDRIADNVLGQPDFISNSSATAQNGFNTPCSNIYDSSSNRLFVGDVANNRIMIFDVTSVTNGENAIGVLGQTSFTTSTPGVSQTKLNGGSTVGFDSRTNYLYVTDQSNRVLVFDVATTTNGEAAINVIGQPNFTSFEASTTNSGFYEPVIVAIDQATDRLFVSDKKNNRVLIFDISTITNGEAAIGVLGQTDFVTNTSGTSQTKFYQSQGLAFDSSTNMLYVGADDNRILIFDVATTTNGEAAVNVIAQPNFTSSTATTTQSGLSGPLGITLNQDNHRLYVGDGFNNRIMIFDLVRITNSSFPAGTVGTSYNQTISITNNQGTTTLSIASGSVPTGLSNTLNGTPTTAGLYNFTLQATDAFSTGNIIFKKDYSIVIGNQAVTVAPVAVAGGGGGGHFAPPPPPVSPPNITEKPAEKTDPENNLEEKGDEEPSESEKPQTATSVRAIQTQLLGLLEQLLDLLNKLLQQTQVNS
ncbi:MAG: NHL repeat-containing protein [Anaplasmataceae bacterium]|nr:NHL repeat-containing protein [Anaplasmataceae bacterium]